MIDATPSSRAEAWRARGAHFSWSPAGESAAPVNVFHVELGDADAPVLALVHGFPTCSIDWFEVAERLSPRYRVCMLDFPGFGFSDKPRGWGYSLRRDAELLDHYLTQIVGAQSVVMVAHDRGDSVALIHAANEAAGRAHAAVEHLVLSNANLFLPLSNLTDAQRLMLHSPELLDQLTPELLAAGMGALMFTPPRAPDDPAVQSPCRDVRARRWSRRAARDDPVSRRALGGRDGLAAVAGRNCGPRDSHLGRLRHRRADPCGEPCLARASDVQARPQRLLPDPRRQPLSYRTTDPMPSFRPSRTRWTRPRTSLLAPSATRSTRLSSSTARTPSCPTPRS